MADNRMMSVQDLAAMLGVPTATVYRWRTRGEGPRGHRLVGGHVRYRASDVEEWLESQADARPAAR